MCVCVTHMLQVPHKHTNCLSSRVSVKKEVSADSREAKSYLKNQNSTQENQKEDTSVSPRQQPTPGPRYTQTHTEANPYKHGVLPRTDHT